MADAETPVLKLVLPEVTGSIDTWGGKLNGNFNALDVHAGTTNTSTTNSLKKSSPDTAEGLLERTATQLLFYDAALAIPEASPYALATQLLVRQLCNRLVPVGTIVMWGGYDTQIPVDWALCTGQVVNGVTTPNLRDRFIMGSGTSFAQGGAGGVWQVDWSGRVGGHVLTDNEMTYHTHHINDPGHQHTYQRWSASIGPFWTYNTDPKSQRDIQPASTSGNAVTGVYNSYSGGNWAHDHPVSFSLPWNVFWPPFYAMAFIMKVKAL